MVSVIIPTYNARQYICRAVDSALAQTYQDIEIIVVDDGSTDDTVGVLKKYGGKVRILSQKNSGPSAARNKGIREARGQYIAFLDSDDRWASEKLEKQLGVIQDDPAVRFVNCSVCFIDEDTGKKRTESKSDIPRQKFLHKLHVENLVGSPSGWLVARECFDAAGVFDESLKVAEDWELALRICKRYKYSVLPQTLLYMTVRPGSQSSDARRNLENELRFIDKIFSDPTADRTLFLKRRALSYRYQAAAIAFREEKNKKEALRNILKSIGYYPIFDKKTLALLVYGLAWGNRA